MNRLRLSGQSPDNKQIIVPAQGIGGDQAGINQGCLAHILKQTRQLDDFVVRKPLGCITWDDKGQVCGAVEH